MAVLHFVSDTGALVPCLARASQFDVVLLIENGVYALLNQKDALKQAKPLLYVLEPDLSARGIESVDWLQPVDYSGFVDLVVQYPLSQFWR